MRDIRVSSTLTVYHDGQFWVGTFECVEEGRLSVCRVVFGAEPSAEEILRLVCDGWNGLRFTRPVELGEATAAPRTSDNPKRRQREAARELRSRGPSTKAQVALSQEREAAGRERKAASRERREQERRERFEQRREKRKRKRRGR